MPSDAEFAQMNAPTFSRVSCSPVVDDDFDFRGIRLAAPQRVEFDDGTRSPLSGAFAHLVVCGGFRFDANYLGLRERFLPRVVVVATDPARRRAFAGTLMGGPSEHAPQNPLDKLDLSPDDWTGRIITEFFTTNLAEIMNLPETEADYYVHATLGGYVSNVVRIAVRETR